MSSGGAARPVLITGGAGFIGTNLAHRLLSQGIGVRIVDNLSAPGVEQNLRRLQETHGNRLRAELIDVRDAGRLRPLVADASAVFHFAPRPLWPRVCATRCTTSM
jgi:CDP-paratose 2-epimerase